MAKEAAKQEAALLNAYLFNGDDDLKREVLAERLTARIAATDETGMNVQVFSAERLRDPEQLLDALNTLVFGASQRLVLVKDAEKLTKEVSERVVEYLKSPNPSTVLALSASKIAANTRLYKAFQSYNRSSIIDAASVKRSELPHLVRQMAVQNGMQISADAARSLIERVGISTVTLNNAIEKLASWARGAGKQELSARDIAANVMSINEPKPWELGAALARRDGALCLRMVSQMTSQTPLGIFLSCLTKLREIVSVQALQARGIQGNEAIAAELGKQAWMLRETIAAASSFSPGELIHTLKEAPQVEARFKSGADADQELALWIVAVCNKGQIQRQR
ncbi:MAG: DNA polymerase III subunit delta [Actinomycetia bacterium]|nr:DNA polymerase III subunit delta [Actinomycetes bacterium]